MRVHFVPVSTNKETTVVVKTPTEPPKVITLPPPGTPPSNPRKTMVVLPGTTLEVDGKVLETFTEAEELHFEAALTREAGGG
jgi:hypothetical protein